jgi:hypothetical protein
MWRVNCLSLMRRMASGDRAAGISVETSKWIKAGRVLELPDADREGRQTMLQSHNERQPTPPADDEVIGERRTLWQETLKVDGIGLDDELPDLSGKSRSDHQACGGDGGRRPASGE